MSDDESVVKELAGAIVGEPVVVETPDGGVADPSQKPGASPEGKPEDDGGMDKTTPKPKADTSEEKPADGEKPGDEEDSESKPGEKKPDEKSGEDPLAGLDIQALLDHPVLGPRLQSWSDRTASSQTKAAVEEIRQQMEDDARIGAEDQAWKRHFDSLTPEQFGQLLRTDPRANAAWSRIQEHMSSGDGAGQELDPKTLEEASTVYALAAQIHTFSQVLEGSDLSAEKKAELSPEHFTNLGQEGVGVWSQSVMDAIIEQKAEARATELLDEKWETFRDGKLAEEDESSSETPPMSPGRRAPSRPDLIETPSGELLEKALADKGSK